MERVQIFILAEGLKAVQEYTTVVMLQKVNDRKSRVCFMVHPPLVCAFEPFCTKGGNVAQNFKASVCMHEQSTNHISLIKQA